MDFVKVEFSNIRWPKMSLPGHCVKNVNKFFIVDQDGKALPERTLHCILKSWLHDEFNECPLDFDFKLLK